MAKQPKSRQWVHKVRPVRVADMRVPPVGVAQRRFSQSQAEEYAASFDPNKFGIPAVNYRDSIYWIVDGQHRIEALKLWFGESDPGAIECNVYQNLSDADMAELFIGLNTRRAVNAFDLFLTSCTADRTRESEVRRVVESNKLKISQAKDINCVAAVGSLCRIHDRAGSVVLGQVLRTVRDAFSGDPVAFDGQLLVGASLVYHRFNGKTNEKAIIDALGELHGGARSLLRKAEAQRERTGNLKTQCIAAAIVDTYNKGLPPRSKDRLPSWWKEA